MNGSGCHIQTCVVATVKNKCILVVTFPLDSTGNADISYFYCKYNLNSMFLAQVETQGNAKNLIHLWSLL